MKEIKGLWIDHRKAVIVAVTEKGEEVTEIASLLRRLEVSCSRARYPAQLALPDNLKQRQFTRHIDKYYDEVIENLRDAYLIFIFGPGEAKGELAKRIEALKLAGRIAGIETAGKMTNRKIAAKVRTYFTNSERIRSSLAA
jgi:DNA-binding transcriptional ArsR family regulator